ncbi:MULTISPECIES: hypothetical protein [Clostridium]|uniref:hypothetical protein n=1 Tax=Clostridium TaxID=1485 RepID=UPI00069F5850|nr:MULTISPECIES: hypothetical protein [Clostridium]KOF57840.1 hypothetical protein AGR56_16690 [Clostridium sp. DMHC 10]MCD2345068.1 hypothetical protein [Clostridium guangxiense]
MKGRVTKNILEYMNSMSIKQFSYIQVSCIASSIKTEYYDRKDKNIKINGKTEDGKKQLNKRIADIVNKKLLNNDITPDDIRLYKRCFAEEYTNRTGKCAWGFTELRQRLGYDPKTGIELKNL